MANVKHPYKCHHPDYCAALFQTAGRVFHLCGIQTTVRPKMQDEGTAGSVHIGVMVGGFCELPALKMVGEALEVPVPGQRFSTRRVDGSVPYLLQMPVSRFSARQVDGHPAARSVRARIRPGLWGGSAAAGPASRCRSRRRCCRIRRLRPCRCRRSNHPP